MKTKARIRLYLMPVLLLLLIMSALGAVSASAAISGDFGYIVNKNGTAKLTSYNSSSVVVTVPSKLGGHKVTDISASTFKKNKKITQVYIPSTVVNIEWNVFSGCSKVKIYGIKGSAAEKFASRRKIPFVALKAGEYASLTVNIPKSLAINTKAQIKAVPFPAYTKNNIQYASSAVSVASMNKNTIIAKKRGESYITVRCGNITKKFKVKVYLPVNKVTVNNSLTLGAGETAYLDYKTAPLNADRSGLKIVSSDKSVAEYKNGKVCTYSPGKAYFGIWYSGKKLAYVNVTVKKAPQKVTISPWVVNAAKGETVQIYSTINAGSFAVTREYTSSDPKVAKIVRNGWNVSVKAISEGTADITVKTYNGKKATCKFTVKPPAKGVKFNDKVVTIGVGESIKVYSTATGGAYYHRKYYSWNTKKVTVNNKGYIKGISVGQTTISVKLPNGKKADCIVVVRKAPTTIHLGRSKLTIELGESYEIRSWIEDGEASATRKYSVTENGVLALDKNSWNGKVTGKKVGTSEITVRTYNGKTDKCQVTVVKESDRKRVADAGISWHRYSEADGSYMEIFDTYNNGRIPGTYYMRGLDPWCATFVSAVFMKAGKADLIYPSCSCPMMVLGAKNMGIWVEDDAYIPERGDIIVYSWIDDGIGDCDYGAYHVGVVVDVNSGTMTMIEGNRDDNDTNGDDFVEYRRIPPNDKFIRGFITPRYKT